MSSIGGKSKGVPENSTKTASFYSPFGSVVGGQGQASFQPNYTTRDRHFLNSTQVKQQGFTDALKPSQTPDQMFGGPAYESSYNLLSQPIHYQQQQDDKALQDNLNAGGLLGGSFNAYQQDLQNRRYNDLLSQAQNQAHQYAFQSNNQNFQNQLAGLQGTGAARTNQYDQLYAPLKYSTAYAGTNASQQASGLQYLAQQEANKAALMQSLVGSVGTVASHLPFMV